MRGYTLGIDLGTTYSAAAIARDGRADRFPLGNRSAAIPSVVCLREDGEVLVGDAAERRGLLEPTRTAREFKRRLGDPTPLLLGGTPYGAEALSAHLLRWIVDRVVDQEGSQPEATVLCHPANWGPFKLDLLEQTVRLAELDDVTFLTEPEAAAVHYAGQERLDAGEVVAVYDFGGGTFDAAVLRHLGGSFELLGVPEGMERIGGIDFDQAVFAHVDTALGGAVAELAPDDSSAMAAVSRLRDECQDAKEQLSHDTDVDIPVLLPGLQTEVRLTRSEFEAMIRPRIGETIRALDRAVRSADLTFDDVAKVLLVGGSSRIPLVGQLVREETGRPIAVDAHPKFAIAIGAALVGGQDAAREDPTTPAAAEAGGAAAVTAVAAAVEEQHGTDAAPAPRDDELDEGPSDEGPADDAPADEEPSDDAPAVDESADDSRGDDPGVADISQGDDVPSDADPSRDETRPQERVAAAVPVAAAGGAGGAAVRTPTASAAGGSVGGDRPPWLLIGGGVAVAALLVIGFLVFTGGDGDDTADQVVADATPSAAEDPDDDATGGQPEEPDESEEPSPSEEAVDPDVTVADLVVQPDGTVEVPFTAAGFDVGDAGYAVNVAWVDDNSQPLDGVPAAEADDPRSYTGFSTLSRPVPASQVCVEAVTPDGDQGVDDDDQCTPVDEAMATGLPGERFVVLDDVRVEDGTYVVEYTTSGFGAELGGDGTWHVHFYLHPTSDEDIVGANIGDEERGSWVAWDAPVFDAFRVADTPDGATHVCGVVAEFDHTILLQDDGTGYPSGTCLTLP